MLFLGLPQAASADKAGSSDLVLRGDAKCTACHDESTPEGARVLSIGKTKHGTTADGRTPTCTTCHGASEKHISAPEGHGQPDAPDLVFGKTTPADQKNAVCLSCHKGETRMFWATSTHASRGVACTNCHTIHNGGHDKVRDRMTQTEVCFTCHKDKRAQLNKLSHHPVLEGKVICSDCHNPHGSAGPHQLKKDSVNETCFQCHAEKRGPFLHNHQPVDEDCTICHNPHGSNIDNMLKSRPPFLCQSCHESSGHPSQIPGILTSKPSGSWFSIGGTSGRGCLNCHTQIHGSNTPMTNTRGVRFVR
jgi:DmsE family decaheme c-type cytochrome